MLTNSVVHAHEWTISLMNSAGHALGCKISLTNSAGLAYGPTASLRNTVLPMLTCVQHHGGTTTLTNSAGRPDWCTNITHKPCGPRKLIYNNAHKQSGPCSQVYKPRSQTVRTMLTYKNSHKLRATRKGVQQRSQTVRSTIKSGRHRS
jgi:hypothetical protein